MANNVQNVEELITQILHMGFQLKDCHEAISAGKLSVEEAVDWLLKEKDTNNPPTLRLQKRGSSQFDGGGIIDQLQNSCTSRSASMSYDCLPTTGQSKNKNEESTPDVKKIQKDEFEKRARKEFEDGIKRERMEEKNARIAILKQIAEDKEQRKQSHDASLNAQHKQPNTVFSKSNDSVRDGCILQVRCPDGRLFKHSFSSTDTLEQLWKYLSEESVSYTNVVLMQPFPKREFTQEHNSQTFEQLKLTPSCSLVLKQRETDNPVAENLDIEMKSDIKPTPADSTSDTSLYSWGSGQKLLDDSDNSDEQLAAADLEELPLANPEDINDDAVGGEEVDNLIHINIFEAELPAHLWGGGQRLGGEMNIDQENILPGSAAEQRVCNIMVPQAEKCNTLMLVPSVLPLQETCIKFIVKQIFESTTIVPLNLPSLIAERILQQMIKDKILRPRYMQNFLSCRLVNLILDCYPYATNELLHSIRYHSSLQHVSLVSCPLINDAGLQSLISLKQLLTLNLRGCVQITDNCFSVVSELGALNSLSLEETKVTDSGLIKYTSTTRKALQVLNVNRTAITENSLVLLKNLPNLKFLSLDGTRIATLRPLPIHSTLKGLSIQATNIPTTDLSHLSNFPELTWLNITDMPNVSGDDGLQVISGLALRHLNLPSRLSTTDGGLVHISGMTLSSLDLTNYINISDVGISCLSSMKSLKKLLLSNTKLTDVGLLALRELSDLEVLYLDRTAITDEGTVAFAGMPKLQELSMASTRIKGFFLTNGVLNRCVLLTKLNLSRTRIKIKALKGVCLPNLCLLNVDGTRLACDPTPLLIGCAKLKHVSAKNLQPPPAMETDSDSD